MQESELPGLMAQVLWAAFALAVLFGAVAQRTHFCTMGAVADIVNMGDWTRMRTWALAIAVAVLGFNLMVALGWVRAADTIYAGQRLPWLSTLLGGLMFGVGMVLASGCGNKTLVRVGGGSLKALVVFVVMGVSAYATLRGITGVLRVNTVDRVTLDLPAGQDLPSLLTHALGVPTPVLALVLGTLVALALLAFVLARPEGRSAEVWVAGGLIGAIIVGVWWVSGVLGYVEEHPLTLEQTFLATNTQRMESLTFVAPVAFTLDWLMLFSDKSKVLTLGIVTTVGVIVGSAVVALATRTFRWESFGGVEDTANHLVGAVLMGVGGVTAMGCTVGQGLTGVSTLAIGSFIALGGLILGAVLGLRWQVWRLERML
jgi:uncharacterized membrane protein YedE/YeeE